MIFGGDYSSWQGEPDFAGLAGEGITFAFHKVTGEGSYISPVAARNLAATRKANIIPGSYDWVEPQSGMAGGEAAKDYLRTLIAIGGRQPGDLLATDFETPDWFTGPLGRNIEPFMRQYVMTLLEEQDLFFYTGPYFLDETGARDWAWLNDPRIHFWEAAPGEGMLDDNSGWPGGYPPFGAPLVHQHQWHATSRYVVGEFDRNRFRGTVAEMAALGLGGGAQEGAVKEPGPGEVAQYLNARGELVAVINMGGEAKEILGVNYADIGGSVRNVKGEEYDRSLINGVFQGWTRRQDATKQLVGTPKVVE